MRRLTGIETCCVPAASTQSATKLIRQDGVLQIKTITQSMGSQHANMLLPPPPVCIYMRATSLKITYVKDCTSIRRLA